MRSLQDCSGHSSKSSLAFQQKGSQCRQGVRAARPAVAASPPSRVSPASKARRDAGEGSLSRSRRAIFLALRRRVLLSRWSPPHGGFGSRGALRREMRLTSLPVGRSPARAGLTFRHLPGSAGCGNARGVPSCCGCPERAGAGFWRGDACHVFASLWRNSFSLGWVLMRPAGLPGLGRALRGARAGV